MDNKVVGGGNLSNLKNDLLRVDSITGKKINNYSIRVWLNDNTVDYLNKHYHFVVNIKEKEEK